ncbi:hypothetical protein BLNAU_17923 [Blattamonas nauphoetae]|uniref:Uncharacterized protein n=1 Tax=Blattamonas nauphoetae TaxID=2049346 RepID=A0ABQ9X5U7_9EUKA|nr:hypothetical protein BLNAU_17923 [Blattamonas nauphoetae]
MPVFEFDPTHIVLVIMNQIRTEGEAFVSPNPIELDPNITVEEHLINVKNEAQQALQTQLTERIAELQQIAGAHKEHLEQILSEL